MCSFFLRRRISQRIDAAGSTRRRRLIHRSVRRPGVLLLLMLMLLLLMLLMLFMLIMLRFLVKGVCDRSAPRIVRGIAGKWCLLCRESVAVVAAVVDVAVAVADVVAAVVGRRESLRRHHGDGRRQLRRGAAKFIDFLYPRRTRVSSAVHLQRRRVPPQSISRRRIPRRR